MGKSLISGEIRTTKEGYEIIEPLFTMLGIEHEMEISGSARLVKCGYDPDVIKKRINKKSNAGRKPKCNLTSAQMQRELGRIGMVGVCEKYGVSERTVYRKLKQES